MRDDPASSEESRGIIAEKVPVNMKPVYSIVAGGTVILILAGLFFGEMGPFSPDNIMDDPTPDNIVSAFEEPATQSAPTYPVTGADGAVTPVAEDPITPPLDPVLAALKKISGQIDDTKTTISEFRADTHQRFDTLENQVIIQQNIIAELDSRMFALDKKMDVMEQNKTDMRPEILHRSSQSKGLVLTNGNASSSQAMPDIDPALVAFIRAQVLQELRAQGVYPGDDFSPAESQNASIDSVNPDVPFELVAIETWDRESMAVITLDGRTSVVSKGQVRLGYRLLSVNRLRKTAEFIHIRTRERYVLKVT